MKTAHEALRYRNIVTDPIPHNNYKNIFAFIVYVHVHCILTVLTLCEQLGHAHILTVKLSARVHNTNLAYTNTQKGESTRNQVQNIDFLLTLCSVC